jgi:DNA-directed RNA polymerase specialized sigma subunit
MLNSAASKPDKLQLSYQTYVTDPTPDNLSNVVDELSPVIDYTLSSINANSDSLIRSKARVFAAEAVKKYDPAHAASLPTWVTGQLMQLRRFKRDVNQPVKVPERIQLDAYTLSRAEQEFVDKHNREPDLDELADYAKMPIKRINKIRNSFRALPSQAAIGEGHSQTETDFGGEALDYIYQDCDKIDKRIIEMKLGYGGKFTPMQPKDIAIRLGITPSQLTRRSAKLALRIQEVEKNLSDIQQ